VDDPLVCWNCEKRGVPGTGTAYQCKPCEVSWFPRLVSAPFMDFVIWSGIRVPVVDFTEPGALGSPA